VAAGAPAASAAGAAQAALLLAALLFALALPRDGAVRAACDAPAELAAAGGHTRAVTCAGGAPLRGPARLLYGLPLDPNRADAATLEALPGIGATRAEAIVAGRAQSPYRSVGELGRVPGIGPVTLARIAPFLSVEEGAAAR
jgi:competence protein ComEA